MANIKQQWLDHIERTLTENQGHRLTPAMMNGLMFAMATTLPPFAADEPRPEIQAPPRLVEPLVAHESFSEVFFTTASLAYGLEHGLQNLHELHWQETEGYRNDDVLKPDYETLAQYEAAGRLQLFLMLKKDQADPSTQAVGNFICYFDRSTHDGKLIATEDALFVLKEWRNQSRASSFIKYIHLALADAGIKELRVETKIANKAGDLLQRRFGYEHVANRYVKRLDKMLTEVKEAA